MEEQVQEAAQPPRNEKKKLTPIQKRTITSFCYVVIWVAMCALKWCVPQGNVAGGWGSIGFDLVFCAVAVIGSFEFLRAIDRSESGANCKISTPQRTFTIAYCAVAVPLYAVMEMIPQTNGTGFLAIACAFAVYFMFLAALSVFDHGKSTVKGTIYCAFCMLYCGVLPTMLSSVNHLQSNSMAAIIFVFVVAALTDTGAFAAGSMLKKYIPYKLAPKLSPNKTVIGAIGGLIGGILGAVLTYYIMYVCGGIDGEIIVWGMNGVTLQFKNAAFGLFSFVFGGLFTAVACQIGDLFESAIKRECGIKDMGNCLPGHGGILDRFDSMLYSGVVVLFYFATIV